MTTKNDKVQSHPANAVFALMDDRQFRYSIIRPALEEDKTTIARLATGKHQLKGFRNISRAPMSMLLPVISDEANLSAEMAQRILDRWFSTEDELKSLVAAKLQLLGYEPKESPFDEDGNIKWQMLAKEHADMQYDGTFIEDKDENAVMLMSLLLGWFGADDDPEEEGEAAADSDEAAS